MPEARHAYHAFERQSAILSPSTGEKPQEREKEREGKVSWKKLETCWKFLLSLLDRPFEIKRFRSSRILEIEKKERKGKKKTGTTIA